ncbi:hypothetical protein D7S86_15225 [Pararobbsia silviterrae]|uniref:Uncharacterized protein n=1 Tax=Pararobbsia silviterrae TaxID=1792498 RepID=A0A494XV79_9BURK|nr:hypothetical protein D7S86_15225 [Pararobbsia silviterrae]
MKHPNARRGTADVADDASTIERATHPMTATSILAWPRRDDMARRRVHRRLTRRASRDDPDTAPARA